MSKQQQTMRIVEHTAKLWVGHYTRGGSRLLDFEWSLGEFRRMSVPETAVVSISGDGYIHARWNTGVAT